MTQTEFILQAHAADGWTVPVRVSRKRVKNLNLRVHADGSVSLSIPMRSRASVAQDFLDRRATWIKERVKRRTTAIEESPIPLTGPDAGTLPLWGKLVDADEALELAASATSPVSPTTFKAFLENGTRNVMHKNGCIENDGPRSDICKDVHSDACSDNLFGFARISTGRRFSELSPDELQERIDDLYRREIARELPETAQHIESIMGVHAARWSIRTMKTRWGSCTPKTGAIRINAVLAAYPPICLEYVVTHELTHLMEPSHNHRFHALLDTYCPHNRETSKLLKRPARDAAS